MAWRASGHIAALLACLIMAAGIVPGRTSASDLDFRARGQPALEQPGMWGEDFREPVPERLAHIKPAIARLVAGDGAHISCTAFCVARDVVATASHCLFAGDHEGRRPALRSVSVEFTTASGVARSRIAGADEFSLQWNVIAGTTRYPARAPLLNSRDWAMVRLEQDLCRAQWLDLAPIQERGALEAVVFERRIFSIGYMRRSGDPELLYSGGCEPPRTMGLLRKAWSVMSRQFAEPEHIVLHRCGFAPGASGSPLFVERNGRTEVIALNNGTIPVPAYLLSGKSAKQRRQIIRAISEASNIAVSASAFAHSLARMHAPVERLGQQDIMRIQAFLRASGELSGGEDGIYDVALRQAILDYERNHVMPLTGRPVLSFMKAARPAH